MIPTYNNASTISDTIDSVSWTDKVLVVDSFSTDGTTDIARDLGATVLQRAYDTSARQKNWALKHCHCDWVFQLDTDERLEVGLAQEIRNTVEQIQFEYAAFRMPRKNHYGWKWLRHGGIYPDYQIRLLRPRHAHWADRNVHAHPEIDGYTGTLNGHILHDGMKSISKQLLNLDRYTTYESNELGKRSTNVSVMRLVIHPVAVFIYRYVWKLGALDGWRGLTYAAYLSFYDFLAQVKAREAVDDLLAEPEGTND